MNLAERIYLDHAATSPMRPEVREAMVEGMLHWANPSSPHADGRNARRQIEDARRRIAQKLNWGGHLIFTSGASEALMLALGRAKGGPRIVSAVEHDAVFRAAPGAEVMPVDREGEFDKVWLEQRLAAGDRPVVAVQHVNPETGRKNLVGDISHMVRGAGGMVIADCAQSAGKYPLPIADMVVISAHKFGGPPGVGALLVHDIATLEPTGGQEFGYRGGTENLPGILGFAAALEACRQWVDEDMLAALRRMRDAIGDAGGRFVGGYGEFSGYIFPIAMPGMDARIQVMRFDMVGFSVSAGSACASGTLKPSRVLAAFGIAPELAATTIRMSIGWNSTPAEIDAFTEAWVKIAAEASARA